MASLSPNLRGILYMVLATGTFSVNDALMKLATVGLPPFEVLFLRGVMASLLTLPVVLLSGNGRHLRHVADKWVVLRNSCEFLAVLCWVVALASMPIADVTALGQIAPMLLLLGTALFFGDRLGWLRLALIAFGFLGALLVAQPGGGGFSPFAILGLLCAVGSAGRDIVGRKVSRDIPVLVVAFGTLLLVMAGAGIATLVFEPWVTPSPRHLLLLCGSGLFLSLGHMLIFLSYRTGSTGAVAPFYYCFAIWAVLLGLFVFGTFPNALAIAGIGLILVSGVAIVLLDERQRRLLVVA